MLCFQLLSKPVGGYKSSEIDMDAENFEGKIQFPWEERLDILFHESQMNVDFISISKS